MHHFWRTVSIAMGALLATGCIVRTKYGIADTEDTADTGDVAHYVPTAASTDTPLPSTSFEAPVTAPAVVPESPVK